jgi:predicted Rossmann-fold nucleotide-binding protein
MSYLRDGRQASAGWICVFLRVERGAHPKGVAEAKSLGLRIADAGWGVVYGGTSIGLMGATADAALSIGAEVIGVLPQAL